MQKMKLYTNILMWIYVAVISVKGLAELAYDAVVYVKKRTSGK